MGWFIIIGAIIAICIILFLIGIHFDIDLLSSASFFTGFMCLVAILIMLGTLINKEARFDAFVRDYESTNAIVENYSGTDYGNMVALTEKVLSINERIANHKAFVNNKLSGVWYSEKIASLDPITFALPNTKILE